MLNKLKERFYWPGHATDVTNWCKTCGTCAQCRHPVPRNRAQLQTTLVRYPMQMVGTDILGPFPVSESGNSYILVAMDYRYFTRWAEAYPIPNQEAGTIAKKLTDEMFLRFSPCTQIRGASLNRACWQKYASCYTFTNPELQPTIPNQISSRMLESNTFEYAGQWRSYTRAYPGLCPHKIRWCPGKNNVEW